MLREFTVAVFVVSDGNILLHWHRKLQRWLPPGGHIEPGELPDEAAVRETLEETGLDIEVLDAPPVMSAFVPNALEQAPQQLVRPLGIQLETIPARHAPGASTHQHIDLLYLARLRPGVSSTPRSPADDPEARTGWYDPAEWLAMGVSGEVRHWARAAVESVRASTAVPAEPISAEQPARRPSDVP